LKIIAKNALFKGINPKTSKRRQEVGRKELGSQQEYCSILDFEKQNF